MAWGMAPPMECTKSARSESAATLLRRYTKREPMSNLGTIRVRTPSTADVARLGMRLSEVILAAVLRAASRAAPNTWLAMGHLKPGGLNLGQGKGDRWRRDPGRHSGHIGVERTGPFWSVVEVPRDRRHDRR